MRIIRPQPGPQEQFLATSADIAFFGGAAGGGKSWSILLEPLRHVDNPGFGGVIFRRENTQITQEGGLWEKSEELYPGLNARPNLTHARWAFPSGSRIRFAHMQHAADKHKYQGGEMAYIGFDELTHFLEDQFWYMVSRNRSTSGVRPYIRASTNPDPDSWVRKMIDWYIGPDGYAIPERSGVIRWFARVNDELLWADTKEELLAQHPNIEPEDPLSFTFILSRLKDNPALTEVDPGYRARLRALPKVERERLLGDDERGGNWNIRAAAGDYFHRSWVEMLDKLPGNLNMVRAWDFAASRVTATNPDPDWTVGIKVGRSTAPEHYVADAVRLRGSPAEVDKLFIATALADGPGVVQIIPQDPGAAGKSEAQRLSTLPELQHISVIVVRPTGDKVTRFTHTSSLAEQGLLKFLRAAWNDWVFSDLEAFPTGKHDDTVDAFSDAVNNIKPPSTWGVKGEAK